MSGIKNLSHYWYSKNFVATALLPLSWLFRLLVVLRRTAYTQGLLQVHQLHIPVIVVGNINVGGSGKTPLVIWLAGFLKKKGWSPGIISRGYGGQVREFSQQVYADSDPARVGDEAVLMAQHADSPVMVDPDRARAARAITNFCDIIISDDGLQHYALGRTIEIAVVDAVRRFGNGYCLPAGPLREPPSRLRDVDFVVSNGEPLTETLLSCYTSVRVKVDRMQLIGFEIINLNNRLLVKLPMDFNGEAIHAVAGIGNPHRFFTYLSDLGLKIIEHPFPDHHQYVPEDLCFNDDKTIIMTEKDAVKCRAFSQAHHWYLPVEASLSEDFGERLLSLLARKRHG
ncbi:MAG: tetraacyldisaccharide 4'-kinase [Gammaproteobacteria bacterium]